MSNAKIIIHRPDLYGQVTTNVINFRVEGINLLSDEILSISFDANDPALKKLSKAAAKIRDTINKENNSPNFVARIEFTRVANSEGETDEIISVKINNTIERNGTTEKNVTIDSAEKAQILTEGVAAALSVDSKAQVANDRMSATFESDVILPLKEIDIDPLYEQKAVFQKYKPSEQDDQEIQNAYYEVKSNIDRTVTEHGSAMFIVGKPVIEEKKTRLIWGSKYLSILFFTLGVSSCGGCDHTSSTHTKAENQAKENLSDKAVAKLKSLPPPKGTYAVLKAA